MLHSSVCGRMEVMELEAMPEESALVKSIGGCSVTLSWLSASWWFFTFAFAVTIVAKEISIEDTEDKEMPQLLVQLEMLNRHHQKRIPIVLSDLQDPLKSDAKWDNCLLVRSQGVRFHPEVDLLITIRPDCDTNNDYFVFWKELHIFRK